MLVALFDSRYNDRADDQDLLIGAFFVGRLDTLLFAPGAGNIGPIRLDSHPIQFRKDLLLRDANHHPYMERLAVIYPLKLRYGVSFATRAGSAWWLIFVMALMPWLRRYRLDNGPTSGVDKKVRKNASLEEETEIDNHGASGGEDSIQDAKQYQTTNSNAGVADTHHALSLKEKENRKLQQYVRRLKGKIHGLGHELEQNFKMQDNSKEDIMDQMLNPI